MVPTQFALSALHRCMYCTHVLQKARVTKPSVNCEIAVVMAEKFHIEATCSFQSGVLHLAAAPQFM